ncbi:CHAT domain-containing protein [Microbacteriaceae bacterium VKM Ac-2854]|nr:CHAT domain-containing protein [Microbacteriaceae bacterium VKM Ac-2854]
MVAFDAGSSRFYADAASRIVAEPSRKNAQLEKAIRKKDRLLLRNVLEKARSQSDQSASWSNSRLFARALVEDPRAADVMVTVVDQVSRALLVGDDSAVSEAGPVPHEETSAEALHRWLNVEFEDRPPGAGFEPDEWYTVAFDFSALRRRSALASTSVSVFPAGVDVVEFSLQIAGTNVEVEEGVRRLRVRRNEKRPQIVRFDFRPDSVGPCTLRIVLRRRGNFCLAVTIEFDAGTETCEPKVFFDGRPVAAAFAAPARSVSLHLAKAGDSIVCSALGPGKAHLSAVLPLPASGMRGATSPIYLQLDILAKSLDIDDAPLSGNTVTPLLGLTAQEPTPERLATIEESKMELAVQGLNLFRRLFLSDPNNRGAVELGTWLHGVLNQEDPLTLQIVADAGLTVPWGLLYVGSPVRTGTDVDWHYFVGVRHVVEQLAPSTYRGASPTVPTDPSLSMAFNGYAAKAGEPVTDAVARQRQYFEGIASANGRFVFSSGVGRGEAMNTLIAPAPPELVYFFCHGSTSSADATGGLGAMSLTFAPGRTGVLSLDRLAAAEASPGDPWNSTPFVVLNACQVGRQAQNDTFDFVTVFLQKNARGVVASHAYIPATFGDSWGQSFFMEVFAGQSVGGTLRALTLHSLLVYGVPLGLLYTSICDVDTRLEPALL